MIDSDVVHRAGTVRRGRRLVVRSRSYEPVYLSALRLSRGPGPAARPGPHAGGRHPRHHRRQRRLHITACRRSTSPVPSACRRWPSGSGSRPAASRGCVRACRSATSPTCRAPRNVTAALTALTGACTAAYLFVGSKGAFVAVAVAFALADRGGYAACQALIARVVAGDELVQVRAYLRSVTNIGVAVGAALAGIAVQLDTAAVVPHCVGLDALSFLACAVVRSPAGDAAAAARAGGGRRRAGRRRRQGRPARASMFAVTRDRMYVALTGANMLLLLHAPMLEVVLPLWITCDTAAPRALVSVLILVNTGAVVFSRCG